MNVAESEGKTALMCAAAKGNAEVVAVLLQHGAEMERVVEPDSYSRGYRRRGRDSSKTALWKAIEGGHTNVVQLLLEKGASALVVDSDEFFDACDNGNLSIVQYAVNSKLFDLNAKNDKGHTGLHLACDTGKLPIVECLVEGGADVEAKSSSGRTALRVAAVKGRVAIASYLITKGANVNEKDSKGISCLSAAATGGYSGMVECLLKNGSEPIPVDDELFRKAARSNVLSLVRHGIVAGTVDVNSKDKDGYAAIHLASAKGHVEIVEFLVDCPLIDVNIKDIDGETALTSAVGNEKGSYRKSYSSVNTEVINCLLKSGVTVTEECFRAAVKKGLFCFVQRVVAEEHLDLNAQDKNGKTALYLAASSGHLRIVELLLEKKADVNAVTKAGTAMTEATAGGHLDVVETLVKGGGDVNLSSDAANPAKTPIWHACEEEKEDVLRFLVANGEYY